MIFGAGLRVAAKVRLLFAGICFSCCQAAAHKQAGGKKNTHTHTHKRKWKVVELMAVFVYFIYLIYHISIYTG